MQAPTRGRSLPLMFIAGFLATLVLAGLAMKAPERFFVGSSFAPEGIRLVRDRYEIMIFRDRSDWIADGGLPYDDGHPQEYPPVGAFFIAAPRIFTEDVAVFEAASLVRSAASFGLLLALSAVLLDRFGKSRLRLLTFFLPAFLYFSLWRFDTFPALFASLGVLAVASERFGAAVIALCFGAAAKVYPAFFLVPLGLAIGSARDGMKARRAAFRAAAVVAGLAVVFLLLARAYGLSPLAMIYDTHAHRGVELGSIREIALRLAESLGWPLRPALALIGIAFGLLQFGAIVPLLGRPKTAGPQAFVRACLYLLIPFVAFGWFFSQQWIIWLAPLVILVAGRKEMLLLIALDILLFLQFPVLFDADRTDLPFDLATLARTGILVALWVLNAKALAAIKRPRHGIFSRISALFQGGLKH